MSVKQDKQDVVSETLASGACEVAPQAPYDLSMAARIFAQRSPVGELDALPLGCAGLRRAVCSAYNLGDAPSDDKITELAEPFRPYRSLYTFYLWQGFA